MEYLLVAALIGYLVPFTIAAAVDHPRVNWILALNLVSGWTGIGWCLALAWARSNPDGRIVRRLPWLHPRPPGRARRRTFRVLEGGRRAIGPDAGEADDPGTQRRTTSGSS